MKVILKDNVVGLGFKDDVVEVKNGYGRNYLIPRGLAVVATKAELKQHEEIMRQREHKLAAIKEKAQQAADALEGVALIIPTKISESGTIYGGVNAAHVAEHLAKLGHDVDRKIIDIKVPVKEAGKYTAYLHFHKEVIKEIPFEVVDEENPVPAQEATEIVETPAPVVEEETQIVEEAPEAPEAPAAE